MREHGYWKCPICEEMTAEQGEAIERLLEEPQREVSGLPARRRVRSLKSIRQGRAASPLAERSRTDE